VATRLTRATAAPPASSDSFGAEHFAVAMVLGVVLVANVTMTWGRWGDVITDIGRELDTALQLSQGRRLYADVRWYYGPLAPYVNALLFRVFGARVEVLATAGLLTGTLLSIAVYRCVRLFAGRVVATAAAVAVLQAGVFVQMYTNNIFNFVVPYTYAATYGTLLATASVYFLLRHVLAERPRDLWVSAGLLALVGLSKLEPLFAAAAAHGVALVSLGVAGRLSLRRAAPYLVSVGGPIVVYGYFYSTCGPALWSDNLFLRSNVTAGDYALRHSGLLEVRESLLQIALSVAILAVCVAVAAWAARQARVWATAAAAIVILAVVIGGGTGRQLRLLPFVLAVVGAQLLWRAARARRLEAVDAALLTFVAFGFAAAARIVLHATAEHYGFYLLMPPLAAFAAWLGGRLPLPLPAAQRTHVAPLAAAWFLGVAVSHAAQTHRAAFATYGGARPAQVGTVRGALPVTVPYQGSVDNAVRWLETQPRGSRVLVVPQGVGITFLAGLQNALGIHALLPQDIAGRYDDARIIADLERNPPDFVVYTSADTREYGKQGFGADYGQAIAQWIEARYERRGLWRTQSYRVAVLGRKPAS